MTEETCSGLLPTVGVPGDALRVTSGAVTTIGR